MNCCHGIGARTALPPRPLERVLRGSLNRPTRGLHRMLTLYRCRAVRTSRQPGDVYNERISDTTLAREVIPLTKARMRVRPTVIMLLWPTSAIGVWLLLDFNRQFNKSSDCFSTRWEVGLAAAPVVYRPQKLLRYPHLKRAILRALRWAATRPNAAAHFCTFCIDKNASNE